MALKGRAEGLYSSYGIQSPQLTDEKNEVRVHKHTLSSWQRWWGVPPPLVSPNVPKPRCPGEDTGRGLEGPGAEPSPTPPLLWSLSPRPLLPPGPLLRPFPTSSPPDFHPCPMSAPACRWPHLVVSDVQWVGLGNEGVFPVHWVDRGVLIAGVDFTCQCPPGAPERSWWLADNPIWQMGRDCTNEGLIDNQL